MTISSYRMIASPIIASIAFVMELTLVPLLLPIIQSDYNLTIGDVAWFFNSYGIAVATGVIAGGWISDIVGARKVFSIGVLMFVLGSSAIVLAGGFETIIVGRILQGFGGGLYSPLVPLLLTKALPKRPGKILIIWGSLTGYAAAFAPLAAGWAIGLLGWQSVFVFFAILAGASLAMSFERTSQTSEPVVRNSPNLRLLFHGHDLWLVFGYIFCTYGAITYYLFSLPLRLTDYNIGAGALGFIIASIWLSFSVASTLLRNWVDSFHISKIVLVAPLLITASFFVVYYSNQMPFLILSAVLMGAGFACSNAPSTQLVLKFAPEGLKAIAVSLDITFARLGGVATVTLLAHFDFSISLAYVIVLSLLASTFALIFLDKGRLSGRVQ